MKKISIVTPVYNEENTLPIYFDAVKKIDYPKDDFEIVFVNDWSNDKSLSVLHTLKNENKDINIKIVDLWKNRWRAISRYTGAQEAKYDNLLFLDSKCEIFPDALRVINNKPYQAIIGNAIQRQNWIFDLFFYIMRRGYYQSGFWDNFEDIVINSSNFFWVSKWTTIFFVNRDLFIVANDQITIRKNTNEDTKIFSALMKSCSILKTSELKVYYNVRSWFISNIAHFYHRWPRFIDYYYKPNNRNFRLINLSLLILILSILLSFLWYFKYILLSFLFLFLFIAIYFGKRGKPIILVFFLFHLISLVFMAGWMKWLFLKSCGKL